MDNSSYFQENSKYVFNTYGRLPVAMHKGEGAYLYDVEGKKYLDCVAGIAVCSLGHAHPKITQAIAAQAQELLHTSNLFLIPQQIELAKKLCELSFADKVFFCNSGAEANEGAVKLARKYHHSRGDVHKYKIITFHHSFHGRTLAMIAATGSDKYRKGFEPTVEGFVHLPFGDLDAVKKNINHETAAIFIEPIQGEGGVRLPPPGFLKALRQLCDEHSLLLIFDEVQTGMGRSGKMFAYEHEEVIPDILSLAKALGNGFPIGALLASDQVAQSFKPGDHASTFGGNPLACRVALEVIDLIEKKYLSEVNQKSQFFMSALEKLKSKKSCIQEVRGRGLMIGIELKEPIAEIVQKALEKGLLINCTQDKVLRLVPPFVMSEKDIEFAVNVLDQIL